METVGLFSTPRSHTMTFNISTGTELNLVCKMNFIQVSAQYRIFSEPLGISFVRFLQFFMIRMIGHYLFRLRFALQVLC
jgi:hypothetical protein